MQKRIVVLFFAFLCFTSAHAFDWDYYTIQKGDSLSKIARKYDISTGEISFWNNIANPNQIQVGQRLRVLRGSVTAADILRFDERDILNLWRESVDFSSPISSWQILQPYSNWGDSKNYGVWLSALGQASVKASAAGRVQQIGYLRGYENFILVDHENGWLSMYSHVQNISVSQGQKVEKGQALAKCLKSKLFFLTSYKGRPVNPEEIVKR